jgi:hypothetical protein
VIQHLQRQRTTTKQKLAWTFALTGHFTKHLGILSSEFSHDLLFVSSKNGLASQETPEQEFVFSTG